MSIDCFDNRELSWLKFNERVLGEAKDSYVPLLERLGFSAIFQSNLDEFFMVRVGSLYDKLFVGENSPENKTGMTVSEQLNAIFARCSQLEIARCKAFDEIMRLLENHSVRHENVEKLEADDEEYLRSLYENDMRYLVSPLIIDKRYPFPFLKNNEIYAAFQLEAKSGVKIGLVPVADVKKRLIFLPEKGEFRHRYVLSEDVILKFAGSIFENYRILGSALLRVTRNADINADDALSDRSADYREVMEKLLKKRRKLCAVRMQIKGNLSVNAVEYLCSKLELKKKQTFFINMPLDLSYVYSLSDTINDPALSYPKLTPQNPEMLDATRPIMPQIEQHDVLLRYPFESIKPFIKLLNEAADDKDVVSVKMTLYRLAKNSSIVEALARLAENGKNVLVLIELRARFDEANNIDVSRKLQEAGCTVIFGPKDFKVHSKLLLITKQSENGAKYITQIGTGNYNEKTAAIYTDLSYITAKPEIAHEAQKVFDALSTQALPERSELLLVAPFGMQSRIIELIDEQIENAKQGKAAYIGVKINSLTDKVIIDRLILASKQGVKIDMCIRGICCLIPGVEGQTENIRIISIVGRFLEHSRIYIFGDCAGNRKVFISSADFMTRNTVRRVEIAAPILDANIEQMVVDMFETILKDNVKVRELGSDKIYRKRVADGIPLDSQIYFYTKAYDKALAQGQSKNSDSACTEKNGIFSRLKSRIKRKNEEKKGS
ncbi:MAG: polyphosphate kinase 1 [Oscillospiraceae bacterium]|nr:polyphosphate kinase 1 [Oscillospiraceae bacterium]